MTNTQFVELGPIESDDSDMFQDDMTAWMIFPTNNASRSTLLQRLRAVRTTAQLKTVIRTRKPHMQGPRGGAIGGKAPCFERPPDTERRVKELFAVIEGGEQGHRDHALIAGIGNGMLAGSMLLYYQIIKHRAFLSRTNRRANPSVGVVEFVAKHHNLDRPRTGIAGLARARDEIRYVAVDEKLTASVRNTVDLVAPFWAAWLVSRRSFSMPTIKDFWHGIVQGDFLSLTRIQLAHASDFFGKDIASFDMAFQAHSFGMPEVLDTQDDQAPLGLASEVENWHDLIKKVEQYVGQYQAKTKYCRLNVPA